MICEDSGSGSSKRGGAGTGGGGSSKNDRSTKARGRSERKVKSSKTRLSPRNSSQTSRSSRTNSSSEVHRSPKKTTSAKIPRSQRKGSSSRSEDSHNAGGSFKTRIPSKTESLSDDNKMHWNGSVTSTNKGKYSYSSEGSSRTDRSSKESAVLCRDSVSCLSSRSGDSSKAEGSSDTMKSVTSSQFKESSTTFTSSTTTRSSTSTKSAVVSNASVPCVIHGPSSVIKVDGQLKCGRCVKRPARTRIDKVKPVLKKIELPKSVAPLDKQRKLLHLKTIRNAYLQVTTLPVKVGKTADTLKRELNQRLRKKDEVAEMVLRRKIRMTEICHAYDLTWPFSYSRYLIRPVWLRQRQRDMSEYLHKVQAVVQSLERRDGLQCLADMKKQTNNLYRTTKRAAWRVVYIREDMPLSLDILRDQDAAASYKDCLRKIDETAGPRPKATVEDNVAPSYTNKPRATGGLRRYSIFTYRAKKYNLRTYRNQTRHKYSTTYMVKSIIWMNQVLCPRRSGKRNFTIAKQLRTVRLIRKLFYNHNENFRRHLKLLLAEHATGLEDPRVHRKWRRFLETGEPPDKSRQVLAMVTAVDKSGAVSQFKSRRKSPGCEQCHSLKQSIKQTARDIAKVKGDIREIRSREKKAVSLEERKAYEALLMQLSDQEEYSNGTISVSIKPKQQLVSGKRAARSRSPKITSEEANEYTDMSQEAEIAKSPRATARQSPRSDSARQESSFSYTLLARKIVSDVYAQIQQDKGVVAAISSLAHAESSTASSRSPHTDSESGMSTSTLASQIVSCVLSRIEQERSVSTPEISSTRPSSDSLSTVSKITLVSLIVSDVFSRIAQEHNLVSDVEKGVVAAISSLAHSESSTASSRSPHTDSESVMSTSTLASQIVSCVLSRIEQERSVSTPEISSTRPSSDSLSTVSKITLVSLIVSHVFSRIAQEHNLSASQISGIGCRDSDTTFSSTTLASQIVSWVFSRIKQEQRDTDVIRNYPIDRSSSEPYRETASRFEPRDSDIAVSTTTLASQIVSRVFSRIVREQSLSTASYGETQSSSISDTTSQGGQTKDSQNISGVFSRIEQDQRMGSTEVTDARLVNQDSSLTSSTPDSQIILHKGINVSSITGNERDAMTDDNKQHTSSNALPNAEGGKSESSDKVESIDTTDDNQQETGSDAN